MNGTYDALIDKLLKALPEACIYTRGNLLEFDFEFNGGDSEVLIHFDPVGGGYFTKIRLDGLDIITLIGRPEGLQGLEEACSKVANTWIRNAVADL